jgi:Na+-transporting NADH:ubiquinone oxidoreductase subunit C
MQRSGTLYTLGFALVTCVICSIIVSTSAVSLKERQEANKLMDLRKNVLEAAGLRQPGEKLTKERVTELFASKVVAKVVDLRAAEYTEDVDPETYSQAVAAKDPAQSREAPVNKSKVKRIPHYAVIYQILDQNGQVDMVILPIEGYGLWSTLYGFLALDADGTTIRGITYYQHAETPGLGGEVDNPRWKGLWKGRKAFSESGDVAIRVIKGPAGSPVQDPHQVDGLSGATITGRGITEMLRFWLGENGFGPFLIALRDQGSTA